MHRNPDNTDTDGDGVPDCSDNCPNVTGQIGSPCIDGDACTINDVLDANCQCVGTPNTADSDGDGVVDCQDNCPSIAGQIGSPCNDGNANTSNDVINSSCQCIGTPCVSTISLSSNSPVCPGDTVFIQATVTGVGPYSFTWSGQGQILDGQTGSDVKVVGASTGTYSVVVTTGCGTVTAQCKCRY